MLVIALHTAYLAALFTGSLEPRGRCSLALAAYAAYVVNATQFILKLRAARLGEQRDVARRPHARGGAVSAAGPRRSPRAPLAAASARPPRTRPARGLLRTDRDRLAAPQDPGRLLPGGRLAHLRASHPVGRRRDDLRRAALRHRHHRGTRPRGPHRRQRRARPRGRRGCSSGGPTSSCCSWSAPARRK